jgi:transglycosylase-like protein with SLT domain
METADNVETMATRASEEVVRAIPKMKPRPMPRWILPALAIQVLILGLFAASSWTLVQKLDELSLSTHSTNQEATAWGNKTAALKVETDGLKSELQNLRHYLASSSNEDVIFLKTTILRPDIDPELARNIAKYIHRYAQLYGRDPNLVLAMIAVESKFNPNAVSPVGALGLMQVMPQWKKVLGVTGDLADPETSIKYGLQILGFYSEMYKDMEVALTAYNRGPGAVDGALMKGKDPKNGYAPRVLATYERLKKLTVSSVAAPSSI